MSRHILLTGAAGFLGKVILEELLRRHEELDIGGVVLLLRPSNKSARERFEQDITQSPCMRGLETQCRTLVSVVEGDLRSPGCGLSEIDLENVARCTHVIHSAASIEFDLPIQEARKYNIDGTLQLLEVARGCRSLERFVQISTAYTNPHTGTHHSIPEELVRLPRSAGSIYGKMLADEIDERALLKELRLPNTYTVTKCLSEHMLVERAAGIPLEIVRPSIIGPSWRYPFPGWIDSMAASAGFIALMGTGFMRVMDADRRGRADIVPVDFVADAALRAAFGPRPDNTPYRVHHAVSGTRQTLRIEEMQAAIVGYFRRHPIAQRPGIQYTAPGGLRLKFERFRHERLPLLAGSLIAMALGQPKQAKRARRMDERLANTHVSFRYFTHHTFNFIRGFPFPDPAFDPHVYFNLVVKGVHHHLLKQERNVLAIGGKSCTSSTGRLLAKPESMLDTKGFKLDPIVHAFSAAVRLASDHCLSRLTFDRESFESAMAKIPDGAPLTLLPTHRSYIDPLAWSYLFHNHPELGIQLPKIAATLEFSKLPLLSSLLSHSGAFYVKRGMGRADPALAAEIRDIVASGKPIEFFVEGMRSRTGRFMPPRRGLLRCLQSLGRPFHALPLTATYDRVPERETLLRELRGEGKVGMSLGKLARFGAKVATGKENLGRVHLRCGTPLIMNPDEDVAAFGRRVLASLQETAVVSSFHLECFLDVAGLKQRLTLAALKAELENRGARVVDSPLKLGARLDPDEERWMRHQWMHWLLPEALARHAAHWSVRRHVERNLYSDATPATERKLSDRALTETQLSALISALLAPVVHDYRACLRALAACHREGDSVPHPGVLARRATLGSASPSLFHEAYETLQEEGVLKPSTDQPGTWDWGPEAARLEELLALASLPLSETRSQEKFEHATAKKARTRHGSDRLPRKTSDRVPLQPLH